MNNVGKLLLYSVNFYFVLLPARFYYLIFVVVVK